MESGTIQDAAPPPQKAVSVSRSTYGFRQRPSVYTTSPEVNVATPVQPSDTNTGVQCCPRRKKCKMTAPKKSSNHRENLGQCELNDVCPTVVKEPENRLANSGTSDLPRQQHLGERRPLFQDIKNLKKLRVKDSEWFSDDQLPKDFWKLPFKDVIIPPEVIDAIDKW